MKRPRVNPIQIVNEHFSTLQERLRATADSTERNILRKRLRNLQSVRQFLASVYQNNRLDSIDTFHRTA